MQVSADDLADFGLLPEFIGRLPVVSVLEELTERRFGPNPRRTGKRAGQAVTEAIRRRWGDVDLYRRGDTADFSKDADSAGTGARDCVRHGERRWRTPCSVFPASEGVEEVVVDEAAVTDRARNHLGCVDAENSSST